MSVAETKNNLFEHSAAKVELYTKYLERYLVILDKNEYVGKINLYDVFCGLGIYENGGKGSPVQAFELVKKLKDQGRISKRIALWLNDFNPRRVDKVKHYIEDNYPGQNYCEVKYTSLDAGDCLQEIHRCIIKNKKDTHNLLFIDPYGYKTVKKSLIDSIMSLGHTEVLVFLPVDYLYRFAEHALKHKSESQFAPLANFLSEFFRPGHKVLTGKVQNEREFIDCLTEAFSNNQTYYSTSYYIERSVNKYYALFFVTKNALGCEKMLEVKWTLDESSGRGFKKEEPSLFSNFFMKEEQKDMSNLLRDKLVAFMRTERTNEDIYDFVLRRGFLPKHANDVLRSLQNSGQLIVTGTEGASKIRKGTFHIKYSSPQNKGKNYIKLRVK